MISEKSIQNQFHLYGYSDTLVLKLKKKCIKIGKNRFSV